MKILQNTIKPVYSWANEIEAAALIQIQKMAQLDIIPSHIAIMPDVHAGIGATVGTVIPTYKAVIPAAVGVDIGCGMSALRTNITADELPDDLKALRTYIEWRIPVGFNMHPEMYVPIDYGWQVASLVPDLHWLGVKYPSLNLSKWQKQLCTLGGGNHFIELCLDAKNYLWIMLHSGSRGTGNQIGTFFIEKAKKEMGEDLGKLPDEDLAYFTADSESYNDYVKAVSWAQAYAKLNRDCMMREVIDALRVNVRAFQFQTHIISCHHNYIQFIGDTCLTRKGAVNASRGEWAIIPGSMGASSYIVQGLGNPLSHDSCSHGAGRKMSRNQAKKTFTLKDLEEQTSGVECRKDAGVLDEIPGAYKNIDEVMALQSDLVEIKFKLQQILCIKG